MWKLNLKFLKSKMIKISVIYLEQFSIVLLSTWTFESYENNLFT